MHFSAAGSKSFRGQTYIGWLLYEKRESCTLGSYPAIPDPFFPRGSQHAQVSE